MTVMTQGTHHLGFTVGKLEESARFFTELLGWKEVMRNPDYPAIFVSDGKVMVTLWQADTDASSFDRKKNVGLHHVAFLVDSEAQLNSIHDTLKQAAIDIEFSPELLRDGPAKHMMCSEPSGIRVEFICPQP